MANTQLQCGKKLAPLLQQRDNTTGALLNNIQSLTEATSDIIRPSLNAHSCSAAISAFLHVRKFL